MSAVAAREQEQGDLAPFANVEAEASLLGALMIHNPLCDAVAEIIPDHRDFYEPLHGRVYDAILTLVATGSVANPVTLRPLFENDEALRDLGGVGYLAQLTGSGAAVIGAKDFARQINELARIRTLFSTVDSMRVDLSSKGVGHGEAFEVASKIEALAYEAGAKPNERSRSFSMSESIDRTLLRVKAIQSGENAVGALAPDIPEFGQVVGPLERGNMIVVAGRPGMGKSGLMTSAARSMAAAGYGVGIISLEMSDIDLGTRFAADVALSFDEPIKHSLIRDGKIDADQLKILDWCSEQVRQLPIRLVETSGINLARLAMRGRAIKRELEAKGFRLDVLWVDYLQLVHANRQYDSKVAEVTEVSKGIKELAKELDCAVVALSQLSRAVEQREDKRPQLSDLRESGSIEQDADTVCFLYRDEYYLAQKEPDRSDKPREYEAWRISMDAVRDKLDLIVPKRRAGASGKAQCLYLREYQAIRAGNYWSQAPGGIFNDA